MARKIVITSGKGGVGKTSVTAFLGCKLAEAGERVVLVDLDLGLNNLDVTLGIEDRVIYDIVDVIEGRCRAMQALIQCDQKNLYVVPSNHTFSKQLDGQSVKLLIEGLKDSFDYVLIDCPAGIDIGFQRAISTADEAIVVLNPSMQCMRDADKVLTILKNYRLDRVGVVVNRVRNDLVKKGLQLSDYQISEILRVEIIASIEESDDILTSKGYLLPKISKASNAFKRLSKNIKAESEKSMDKKR